MEPAIVVESREELAYLLAEAAEIEHGLMCCYLYAAFGLKRPGDGLSPREQTIVDGWRRAILDVAKDEMVHLGLVQNLLLAIGTAPHFERSNFPVSAGYHPAGVVVSLAPLDRATVDHFVYLERPEGVSVPDGAGFEAASYRRPARRNRLVPTAQDYETVGHLYRGVRAGLASLAETLGERALFVGDPEVQVGADVIPLPGMAKVRSLAESLAAIDTIVHQGEGASESHENSHYAAFTRIRDEYAALLAENPAFEPSRRVARNPVMRAPPVRGDRVWVAAEPAATKLDVANGTYALMLRALHLLYSPLARAPHVRAAAAELVGVTMRLLVPLAEELTTLPATDDEAGPRAGLTFTMSRSLHPSTDASALAVLAEATRVLESRLTERSPALQRIAASLADGQPASPTPKLASNAAAVTMGSAEGVERARGRALDVLFEGKRCIHSRGCVLDAPQVFRANTPGEWIFPDEATAEELVAIAHACPSGAIRYERHDGGPAESAPRVNVIRIRENGPLAVHAAASVDGVAMHRATLCRCGASRNKPFCDGSHTAAFVASGEPATQSTDPLPARDGELAFVRLPNGPLRMRGNVEICAGTGRVVHRTSTAMLCRCGGSANKPFCDGTHARIGFVADGADDT
jgi:CDGSH-type Zn-finger protein/uncharacterized Fe-S cluster protein YjdI